MTQSASASPELHPSMKIEHKVNIKSTNFYFYLLFSTSLNKKTGGLRCCLNCSCYSYMIKQILSLAHSPSRQ